MSAVYAFINSIIVQILNPILLLLTALAFVLFVAGAVSFIINAGNDVKRSEARNWILWGLVGLVIMFGAYGILNIALSTFGLNRVSKSNLQHPTQTSVPTQTTAPAPLGSSLTNS